MKFHLVIVVGAMGLATTTLHAQSAPSADPTGATPVPSKEATSPAGPAPAELYAMDYDEATDIFSQKGTKVPFTGPVISHFDNGAVELTGALKDGLREGRWVEYYEDGTRASEGTYVANKEDGPWKYWSENGALQCDALYANGIPTGTWKTFFEDGKPDAEGGFKDGKREGIWTVHDAKTGKARPVTYRDGERLP